MPVWHGHRGTSARAILSTQEEVRNHVLTHGCYSPEENLRIYEKHFSHAPRYLFRAADRKYGIAEKVLCDVGCGFGADLLFCASGSYGIEIEGSEVEFARSLGLRVCQRDVLNDDLADLPKVEVVWCSAVLEHVEAPHIFLRALHRLLEFEGLLALYVPTIPLFPWFRHFPGMGHYASGYRRSGHIYAFVPSTLEFTCEGAGFRTLEVSPFYPGPLRVFDRVPLANRLVGRCVYVGRKVVV